MEALFLKVLNMSVTAACVVVFVLVFRMLLRRMPKWISFALWGLVLFRLVCPVSFSSVYSIFGSLGGAGPSVKSDGMAFIPPVIRPAAEHTSAEVSGAGGSAGSLPASPALPGAGLPGEGLSVADPMQTLLFIGMCVWLAGIAAMLLYGALSYLRLKRKVCEATRVGVNIYETDGIASPFVLGLLRPKIYLPLGLNETGCMFVLRHERAHIKRGDHILRLLAYIVLSVHWFNPFVWLAFILSGRDMETSCDERVIRDLGPEARARYGETLAGLAIKRSLLAGSPLAFGENGVKSRVRNVLKYKKPALLIIVPSVIAVALLAVCLLTNPEKSAIADGDIISARIDGAEIPKKLYTELAVLIDSYGRSNWKTNTSPITRSDGLFGEPDYTITLNMADSSAYTLKKYYTSAWSLFHGEYGYRYVLGFEANGEEIKAWMMSEDFSCSREFRDWQNRLQKVLSATDNTADAAAVSAALEAAIIDFMEDGWWYTGEKHPGTFKAASFVTLYGEETYGGRKYYGVSMFRSYNFTENSYSVAESFQISCVITLDKTTLACTDFWIPGDGAYFEMDIYNKFPAGIAENAALRYVDYHDRQAAECDEKARIFGGFEDATPLLTVTSGGTTAVPYENFLWSYVYSEDNSGWLSGDAMSVLQDLGAVLDRLPTVTLREDFKITCAGNVTSHGVTVVAGESLEVLYRNADKMILTALPEGAYYVVVGATKQGDYIEAGGDYESEGFECVFRYNVDEHTYDNMLMSRPLTDRVCIDIRRTTDCGRAGYLAPKDQEAWLAALNNAASKGREQEGSRRLDSEVPLGIYIVYQDAWWEVMDSGALTGNNIRVEAKDAAGLFELVMPVIERYYGGAFRPDRIDGVLSATLELNGRTYTVTDQAALSKLESLLSAAKELPAGAGCPFDALLGLEMADDTVAVALSTDDCATYMVNGVYFEYDARNNKELYALFG